MDLSIRWVRFEEDVEEGANRYKIRQTIDKKTILDKHMHKWQKIDRAKHKKQNKDRLHNYKNWRQ